MIRHPISKIRLESLCLENDHGKILRDVTAEIQAGQHVWFDGETSDTYLMRVLAGLEPRVAGKYFLNEESVYDMTFEEFIPYRLNLGYAFPWGGILNNRTMRDNIMLPFMYHGYSYSQAEAVAMTYMEEFGMTRFGNKRPASVPGAIRKLTCLIRALALEPQFLLLDDPLTALSKEAIRAFHKHIEKRRKSDPQFTMVVCGPDQEGLHRHDFICMDFIEGSLRNQRRVS